MKRRFDIMKNLIAMMNAMKFYKTTELVNEADELQEKLSQDINPRAYNKMIDKIHAKHFRSIIRK